MNQIRPSLCALCEIYDPRLEKYNVVFKECAHQAKSRKEYEEFDPHAIGLTRLAVDTDTDYFCTSPCFNYTRTERFGKALNPSVVEKIAHVSKPIRKSANKTRLNHHVAYPEDYENWNELLTEYMDLDKPVLEMIAEVVEDYRTRPYIRVTAHRTIHDDTAFRLIPARYEDEECVSSFKVLSQLISQRFENGDGAFYLYYSDFVGRHLSPFIGDDECTFVSITPILFAYLFGRKHPNFDSMTLDEVKRTLDFRCRIMREPEYANPQILNLQVEVNGIQRSIRGLEEAVVNYTKGLQKATLENNNPRKVSFTDLIRETEIRLVNKRRLLKIRNEDLLDLAFRTGCKLEVPNGPPTEDVLPAMDSQETQAEVAPVYEVAENTALSTDAIETPTVIMDQTPPSMLKDLLSDQTHMYPSLTERFVLFDTIELNTSISRGDVIKQYHMPADFVLSRWDTPNMLPFKSFEFVRGGVAMKFVSNIPKTSQFYMRYGVVYHWLQRDRRDELVNVHTTSQQPGGRIHGHMAPSDEVVVPFFSYTPTIPILPNGTQLNLYYFTISLIAMTDFEIATGAIPTAELNVYAKFLPDLEFNGMRRIRNAAPDFTIPNPEVVLPAMLSLGSAVGVKAKGVATQAVSQVAGSALNVANSVVRGTVKSATSILTKSIEKSISQGLASLGSNRDKPTQLHNEALHQRAITNIASGSGLYSADSYRLQAVGSTPHPLSLVGKEKYDSIAKIIETEGFVNSFTVNSTQFQGQHLAAFRVVPGNYTPAIIPGNFPNNISSWTPLDHMSGWFLNYHGRIHFRFVVVTDGFKTFRLRVAFVPNRNVLTYEDSDSVYFETFDVGPSLDAQCSFDFITPYIHNQTNVNMRQIATSTSQANQAFSSGSIHVFLEVKINMPAALYPSCDVLVFKRAQPGEFTFTVPRNNTSLLKVDETDIPPIPDPEPPLPQWNNFNFEFVFSNLTFVDVLWTCIVTVRRNGVSLASRTIGTLTGNAVFLVTSGTSYRSSTNPGLQSNAMTINVNPTPPTVSCIVGVTFFGAGNENEAVQPATITSNGFVPFSFQYLGSLPVVTLVEEEDIPELILPAGDIREDYTDAAELTPGLTPFDAGLQGEDHMHLYENLRRFNYWHQRSISTSESSQGYRFLALPCNFGAALLRQFLTDQQRSDKITQMHDCFRITRGSLRFLFNIVSSANGIIRVVHVPQVVQYPFTDAEQLAPAPYQYSGFAESIISLQQNNISTHEFPMYLPTNCVLNASYLSEELLTNISQGLGIIELYWQGPPAELSINISRALGDDAQFYLFNGFPLRSPIQNVGSELKFYPGPEEVLPAMFKVELPDRTAAQIEQALTDFSKTNNSIQDFCSFMSGNGGGGVLLGTLFTQIAHVIANPELKTFCLSVFQILVTFKIVSLNCLERLSGNLGSIWSSLCEVVSPAGDCENDLNCFAELSATIVTGLVSFFDSNYKKKVDFCEKLTFLTEKSASIHSRVLEFLKSLFNYIKRAISFVVNKLFPESVLARYLKENTIETWISRVNIVTNPVNWSKIRSNRKASSLVFKLTRQGESIMLHVAKSKNPALYNQCVKAYNEISKLRKTIALKAHVPIVKYDPFCFYLSSTESQIGKSEMLEELVEALLIDNGICKPEDTDKIYVVPESDKFWSGYTDQKGIIFDDFCRQTPTEGTESNCAHLCNLKGEAAWEVPKAFEDKGSQSVVRVIGCASNIPHPKHNSIMNPKIVWSRRNLTHDCSANFNVYPHCDVCSIFKFSCAQCMVVNKFTDFSTRDHLSFVRYDPNASTMTYIGPRIDFAQYKAEVLDHGAKYIEYMNNRYEKRIESTGKRHNDDDFNNYTVPASVYDDFTELCSSEFFDEVVGNAKPAMFRNFLSFMGLGESPVEVFMRPSYVCPHHKIAEDGIEPNGYAPLEWLVDGKIITLDCDLPYCPWTDLRAQYWQCLFKAKQDLGEELDPNFPVEFNEVHQEFYKKCYSSLLENIEKQEWYKNKQTLRQYVMGAIFFCGALATTCYVWNGIKKENKEKKEIELKWEAEDREEWLGLLKDMNCKLPTLGPTEKLKTKDLHPALMASDDVKTKFVSRVKTFVTRPRIWQQARAKPAMSNEYESMKRCYEESVIEMIDYTGKNVARCVSISPGVYLTQIHSFSTVMMRTSEGILDCKSCCANGFYDPGLGCENDDHVEKCLEFCRNLCRISFVKRTKEGKAYEICLDLKDFLDMNDGHFGIDTEGSDMVTFKLNIQHFKTANISKYLVTESANYVNLNNIQFYDPGRINFKETKKEEKQIGNYAGKILSYGEIIPHKVENYHQAKDVRAVAEQFTFEYKDCKKWASGNVTCVLYGYSIKNPSTGNNKGACGSVIFDKSTCTILGIMSAAAPSTLYFNAISKDQVKRSFGVADKKQPRELETSTDSKGREIVLAPSVSKMVSLERDVSKMSIKNENLPAMMVYHTTKTTIRKSKCHEVFGPVVRAPCNLSQNGDRGQAAMQRGLSHYKPHEDFPGRHTLDAFLDLTAMFKSNNPPIMPVSTCRSIQEAVCGIDGIVPRLTMSTSPGFPWCCDNETSKKSDLMEFDDSGNLIRMHEHLYEQIKMAEEQMENGVVPLTIFQLALKDERLKLDKLDNVRLIQGSPLELTINTRRYLMDFNAAFQANRNKLEHCVGINVDSLEWNNLAVTLLENSPLICVGDFSKFGPRLSSEFIRDSYQIMSEWYSHYGDGDPDTIDVLARRVLNSYNLCFDTVVRVRCGSPSGAINTVVINSMCNMFYIRCAWLGIMNQSLHNFKKYVTFFCYGDDVIFSVKPEVIDQFNNQTISDYFAKFDVKYTDVTKDNAMRKHCSITEATFLKRGFKFFTDTPLRPGVWISVPDLAESIDICNWVRKPKGTKTGSDIEDILTEAALSNCEDAIRKTWAHGRNTFEEFQEKVRKFWDPLRKPRSLTYYTFDGLQRDYGIPVYEDRDVINAVFPGLKFEGSSHPTVVSEVSEPIVGRIFTECSHKEGESYNSTNGHVTDENVGNQPPASSPILTRTQCKRNEVLANFHILDDFEDVYHRKQ